MPDPAAIELERKKVRRLQWMMLMVMSTISQNDRMPVEEASQLVASARKAALRMFPGKESTYDLLYRPRFQRLMREKYNMQ